MMNSVITAIVVTIFISVSSAVKVTFRVGGFPGESETFVVKGNASPINGDLGVELKQEVPFPLYSATVEIVAPDSLEFVYGTVKEKVFSSESKGEWTRLLKEFATTAEDGTVTTLNDFFGDKTTRNALKRLTPVHKYNYTLEPHAIYDENTVSTVNLEVNQADFDKLLKDSNHEKGYFRDRPKPEMTATYTFFNADTKFHAKEVRIKQAGFGSLVQRRKSFNVHFNKEDRKTFGLKKHKLKAMTFDPSLMREYVTIDVLQAMGLPTHRIAWTRFFINGKYVGIYNNLETITKKYLHQRFPESDDVKEDGSFYKCNDKAWMTPATVDLCDLDDDFPETPKDRSDLHELADVFANASDEEFVAKVSALMDVEQVLKMTATELTLLRRDAMFDDGSNYVLWKNSKTGKFQYLIFDHEINMFDMDVKPFDKPFSFFKPPWLRTKIFPGHIPEIPLTRLISAAVPAWQKLFRQYATETAELMGSEAMRERLTHLHDTIRPYVESDPTYGRDMAYTVKDFDLAFYHRIEKSKGDILITRFLNLKGLIPDLLHSDVLDVEIIGLVPFMKQRSAFVKNELAGDDGPESETCTDAKRGTCIFPFKYKGFNYQACTTAGHDNTPWCATRQVLGKTVWWSSCKCNGKTALAEEQESLLAV